jgi:hypothetical protein
MYAGNIAMSNSFTFAYHPIGNIGGGGGTNPAYTVGIQYEREVPAS